MWSLTDIFVYVHNMLSLFLGWIRDISFSVIRWVFFLLLFSFVFQTVILLSILIRSIFDFQMCRFWFVSQCQCPVEVFDSV